MIKLEASGLTDTGMKRKKNEDSLYLDDPMGLYIVADGMGGHKAGEVASMIVVQTMKDYMRQFKHDDDDVEELPDTFDSLSKEANRLISGITLSNRAVYEVSKSRPTYSGMGSTVSAIYLADHTIIAANVGDSPIYLIHDEKIEMVSVPHTVVAEQQAIDPDAAKQIGEQFKHILTRSMGINETVKPDVTEFHCYKGDMLVICSDGLTDMVEEEEILKTVLEAENMDKACATLVQMANNRGGLDNITVIVLKIKSIVDGKGGIMEFVSRLFK